MGHGQRDGFEFGKGKAIDADEGRGSKLCQRFVRSVIRFEIARTVDEECPGSISVLRLWAALVHIVERHTVPCMANFGIHKTES